MDLSNISIMKISTKRGDKGFTSLLDGTRISKASPELQFLGDVDELQAWIGICEIDEEPKLVIMNELYRIMAGEIIDPWFETEMEHNGKFQLLCNNLNVARTICRRAERSALRAGAYGRHHIPYLNRLSDYLYKLSYNKENG